MKYIVLRLGIALITFTGGNYAHTFWEHLLPRKVKQQEKHTRIEAQEIIESIVEDTIVETVPEPKVPFDPSGDYHPDDKRVSESEKFTQFVLEVRRRKGKLIASGHVSHVTEWYKFAAVSVTEKHLNFRTVRVKGVEYKFDGRFLSSGTFAEQFTGYGKIRLEGTLQKSVNGKKVTEINSPFYHYPGC